MNVCFKKVKLKNKKDTNKSLKILQKGSSSACTDDKYTCMFAHFSRAVDHSILKFMSLLI